MGVVFGHMAMRKFKCNPSISGRGKAKAGIIVGYSYIGFYALLFFGAMILVVFNVMTKPDPVFPDPETQKQESSLQLDEPEKIENLNVHFAWTEQNAVDFSKDNNE